MSSLSKLRKNVENYKLNEFYNQMTPEQYREGIRAAIQNTTNRLSKDYEERYRKLQEEANIKIKQGIRAAVDTISVELLYELGRQLGCFEENPEYLEEKIEKVQDIYKNTMSTIEAHAYNKKSGQARKDFVRRLRKVENMFNIKF